MWLLVTSHNLSKVGGCWAAPTPGALLPACSPLHKPPLHKRAPTLEALTSSYCSLHPVTASLMLFAPTTPIRAHACTSTHANAPSARRHHSSICPAPRLFMCCADAPRPACPSPPPPPPPAGRLGRAAEKGEPAHGALLRAGGTAGTAAGGGVPHILLGGLLLHLLPAAAGARCGLGEGGTIGGREGRLRCR